MGTNTKIEWATKTWNPVTGCTPTSEGCAHCYAKRAAEGPRLRGKFGYPKDEPFRAMFCPPDCPDRYYVDALTGWTYKEWVCRLASLRTKAGVVVLKCQECYLKEGKCHS